MTTPAFDDLQQAADWFAVLQDASVSDADRLRWQHWLDTGPGPHAAWQQVQAVAGEFRALSGLPARQALDRGAGRRRAVLRALSVMPVAGMAGWLGVRELPWRGWVAAHRTDTGEQREIVLADGSQVWLNTATALDIDFSATLRRIVLHRGEVLVTSGHDDASVARPLVVDVPQGRLTALGTRFGVRNEERGAVRLAVFDGAVQARPQAGGEPRTLIAGEHALVFADHVEPPSAVTVHGDDWTRGMLVVDGMRLGDFLAELGRYRPGYLGCAPEVADLRIVGAYPLADTDRVLDALQATLPVKVHRPMPWWAAVAATQGHGSR
ncbi:MAG: FecR family protein [Comamonadaceae bacterium]|nr:MAG: FecR family protein [Comamonadaceae bacterium]